MGFASGEVLPKCDLSDIL